MSLKDVRRGNTQAAFNDSAMNWLSFEILFISIAVGFITQSWWVFGGLLIGMMIITWIRKLAIILCILLSLSWSVGVFIIGLNLGGYGAAFVLSILALLITGGFHIGAIEWIDDINYKEE